MTSIFSQVTVASTATSVLAANSSAYKRNIKNTGANTAFLGAASVAASTGFPLLPNEEMPLTDWMGAIYAITTSTSTSLDVTEE